MTDRTPSSGSASGFNEFSGSVSDPLGESGSATGSDKVQAKGKDVADTARQKTGEVAAKASAKASEVSDKASDVAAKAQEKAGAVGDKAQQSADQGMDKAASGLGQAADMLRQQGEQRSGTTATAATKTAEKLEGASQYLKEKDTDQVLTDLESLVRRKPVESLLVAAGVGFVLSKIFS